MDVPAGVTQEEGRTGFLHLPSAVLALSFIARRIQPSLSLVDREIEFLVSTNQSFSTCWAFFFFFCEEKSHGIFVESIIFIYVFYLFIARKNPSSCDCTEIRTHVPTSEGLEVTN